MACDAGSVVPSIRAALRRPGLMRVVMVLLLCIATSLLFVSGIRHVTVKSALVPTFISGAWGVSAKGVTALASNPSIVILSALRGKPFSFLIHQMGKPERFRNIRVAVELSARGVQPGSQFWQRGGSCSGATTAPANVSSTWNTWSARCRGQPIGGAARSSCRWSPKPRSSG